MIITRSPLRISLGGGGTDLPSYYRDHGGFLVAAAITLIAVLPALVLRVRPGRDRSRGSVESEEIGYGEIAF